MADEQTHQGVNEDLGAEDALDYEDEIDTATATVPVEEPAEVPSMPNKVVPENTVAPAVDEYDDEEIEDYVVKLVVNEEPEQSTSAKDLIDAAITDRNGHLIPSKTSEIINALDSYTSTVINGIAEETTAVTDGGKSWWSGETRKWIILGLIGLCILGLLIVFICLFLRRKGGNKKRPAGGSTGTTQQAVNKNVLEREYQRVPSGV